MATFKHTAAAQSLIDQIVRTVVLLLWAKKQHVPIQLKHLLLLHPHTQTHQPGLFCLAWKPSVNKIGMAVKLSSSQRSVLVEDREKREGQQEEESGDSGEIRELPPMRDGKLGLGQRWENSHMQSHNLLDKTKHPHNYITQFIIFIITFSVSKSVRK